MPFKKGHSGAKPKGAKHEKTKQWEALGEAIVTTHAERFNDILEKSDDSNFQKYYTMILEYFKPKQQRTEVDAKVEVIERELPPFMKANESKS